MCFKHLKKLKIVIYGLKLFSVILDNEGFWERENLIEFDHL